MNFEEYRKKKEAMIGKLEMIRRETEGDALTAELDKWIKRLKEDRFVVSVFGHFNNGKSTFLNALMEFEEEVLKEDVAACTAAVTRLKYPQSPELTGRALLKYLDGRTELMDAEVLKTYTSRDSGYAVEQNISEVVLYLESPYLKNGVEIVDTPGFNSTYAIHTDTALKQVENSDACIFMFSYDKPGSSTEFQFLRHVEAHMDKAFFILNKIDLCERTENTVENTVNEILRKMNQMGVHVGDKHIYPLSARIAREALTAHDQERYVMSGLPQFVSQLSAYLTSEENLKDRFESPLKSLLHLMEEERKHAADCIELYGRDQEEQRKAIEQKREKIQEAGERLRTKKKNIRNGVRQEIRAKKAGIDEAVEVVIEHVNTWLEGIDSIFSLNLVSFEDVTLRAFADFMQRWGRISEELENGFLHIVEDNVETDDVYGKTETRIKSMLRANLNFERIEVDEPEVDNRELLAIDKRIAEAREERNTINDELSGLYVKRDRRELLLAEKKKKEAEIARMVQRKEQEISRLSNVQAYRGKKIERVEKTGGIFRSISNKLFGKAYEDVQVDIYDDSEKRSAEKNIERIENQMKQERSQTANELQQMGDEIVSIGGIERKITRLEEDEIQQNKLYLKRILGEQEEKFKVESRLVQIEKSNYVNAVCNAIREYGEASKNFLDGSRDKFISMMDSILETEEQELERQQNELEQMAGIGDRTPEELDHEIQRLYGVKETLMRHMTELSGMRRQ